MGHGWPGEAPTILGVHRERIRRRDPASVAKWPRVGAGERGAEEGRRGYIASTGEGDTLDSRDGHFFGITTHARGASFLIPEARAVVDAGALHARVLVIDERHRVVSSRVTRRCAAGTGQFLENFARYFGIRTDEVGPLSFRRPARRCAAASARSVRDRRHQHRVPRRGHRRDSARSAQVDRAAVGAPAPGSLRRVHRGVTGALAGTTACRAPSSGRSPPMEASR